MTEISAIHCGLPVEYSLNSMNANHSQVRHIIFYLIYSLFHDRSLSFVACNAVEFNIAKSCNLTEDFFFYCSTNDFNFNSRHPKPQKSKVSSR